MTVTLHHGDSLDILRGMAAHTVDAVCCDPPAGITEGFDAILIEQDERYLSLIAARVAHAERTRHPTQPRLPEVAE